MSTMFGIFSRKSKPIPEDWKNCMKKTSDWWQSSDKIEIDNPQIYMSSLHSRRMEENKANQQSDQIIALARIDNRNELLKDMKEQNSRMDDIQLLKHAYSKYTSDIVHKIKGSYSLAAYDNESNTLTCFIDQIGTKNLYYYFDENWFVFARQKKTILSLPFIDKSPNWEYLFNAVLTKIQKEDTTEYLHIHRLISAGILKVGKEADPEVKRYWTLDVEKQTKHNSTAEYVEEFLFHFRNAVERRLEHQDDLTGAHLSGGLDSSGISAVASELLQEKGKELHAFGYTFPDHAIGKVDLRNDTPKVLAQAKHSNIKQLHRVEHLKYRTLKDIIHLNAEIMDGFPAFNNIDTEYEILHTAQEKNIKTMLSGFPGDECVTAFIKPYYLEYLGRGQYLKYFSSKHEGKYDLVRLLGPFFLKMTNSRKGSFLNRKASEFNIARGFKNEYREKFKDSQLLNPDFVQGNKTIQDALNSQYIPQYLFGIPLSLKEYQRNYVCRKMTPFRMESENMVGLKFNIEHRYPMADIDLLQYVVSIPLEQKYSKETKRLLFRNAMKDYVPAEVLNAPKLGGVVKPINMIRKNTNFSLLELYEELRSDGFLKFLNQATLDKSIKEGKMPRYMYNLLTIGVLEKQGKLVIS